jgi:hypothetical protein
MANGSAHAVEARDPIKRNKATVLTFAINLFKAARVPRNYEKNGIEQG